MLVAGIEEDPDGKADKYKWDISMLPEDTDYYVYAVISDENRDYRVYTDKPFRIYSKKWPHRDDEDDDDERDEKDNNKDKDKEENKDDKEKDEKSIKDKVCTYVPFLCK